MTASFVIYNLSSRNHLFINDNLNAIPCSLFLISWPSRNYKLDKSGKY
jgi:hypothetical protein